MSGRSTPGVEADPHDLNRFVRAQEQQYEQVLAELRSGRKRSHWMWYIFPQCDGLGSSSMSKRYSIKSLAEAKAYLDHSLIGPRLIACAEAVLQIEGRSAFDIFGTPDDMKLQSCATLFARVSEPGSVFHQLLRKYFNDQRDLNTLRLMEREPYLE
jgi:uncharacterized protein (DUF1810 family)